MKKNNFFKGITLSFGSLILSSCIDFSTVAIPSAVEIKTDATYQVGFGDVASLMSSFTESFSMSGMLESMSESMGESIQLFDYNAGDDVLSYFIHMPLYELPFDASTYISNMNLDSILGDSSSGLSIDQTISLPASTFNMDNVEVKTGTSGSGETSTEINLTVNLTSTPSTSKVDFSNLSSMGVKKFSFKKAVITLYATLPEGWNPASNISATVTSMSMGQGDTTENKNASKPDDGNPYIFYEQYYWTATDVEPENATFSPQGSLKFTIASGTTINSENPIVIKTSVEIEKLSSVTIDTSNFGYSMEENTTELPSTLLDYVSSITFGQDSTHYKHTSSNDYGTTAGEGRGIKCNVKNTLGTIPITITSKALNLGIESSITENTEATETSWVQYNELSFKEDELKSRKVSSVTTDETTTYYMDLTINMGNYNETDDCYELTLSNLEMGKDYTISLSDVSFVFDWDTMTMNTSSLSQEGSFDMSSFSFGTMLSSTGILSSDDIKNIEFSSMPLYFYMQKPSSESSGGVAALMDDLSFTGKMYIDWANDSSSGQEYIIGNKDNDETITLVKTLTWPTDTSATLTADDIKPYIASGAYSFGGPEKGDFAKVANKYPDTTTMNYSLTPSSSNGASSIVVHSYMLESSGEESSSSDTTISLDIAAIISFNLNIGENGISLDLSSLTSSDSEESSESSTTDLLGRSSVSDYADYATYADAIKSVGVKYQLTNFIMQGTSSLIFTMDDTHSTLDNSSDYSKVVIPVPLKTKEPGSFSITGNDISLIMTHYFNPDISFGLSKGTMYLSRSAILGETSMEVPISLVIDMDGTKSITVWKKSE